MGRFKQTPVKNIVFSRKYAQLLGEDIATATTLWGHL